MKLAIRLTARVVDAALYPAVLGIRAWDAFGRAWAEADAHWASKYANGLPGDDQ